VGSKKLDQALVGSAIDGLLPHVKDKFVPHFLDEGTFRAAGFHPNDHAHDYFRG
jgi:hypothetical protein